MPNFETIIRPFTAPAPLGTRRIPIDVTQVPDADAILTWGDSGDIPNPQEINGFGQDDNSGGNFFGFQIKSCNTKNEEQTRKSTTQRVTNPDDPSQFVDVQTPAEITFQVRQQPDILPSGFGGPSTTWANADEIWSLIEDAIDPPNQQDSCQQSFKFSAT